VHVRDAKDNDQLIIIFNQPTCFVGQNDGHFSFLTDQENVTLQLSLH
jgi:hypothetical protein